MNVTPHIFREYDIRGVVGEGLSAEVAAAVGRAYAAEIAERHPDRSPEVAVGRDNRPSSPALAEALVEGLNEGAEQVLETDGALQVTGSHNPAEYNGIKMTMGGHSFFGDDIQAVRARIESGELPTGEGGSSRSEEVLEHYVDDVARRIELERPVTLAVDCGNGAASLAAVELLEAVGARVRPLYCTSDGTFPNHHPDPTVDEYLADLMAKVRGSDAELGVAFDGDADRVGVVDEKGEVVRADLLLLLLGLDLLDRKGPGQKLVFDVKCSQVLPEVFEEAGGEAIMWKTGHSLMKEKMRETGAPLGGELSGHLFLPEEYYGFDDALYAACRLVELVSRSDRPLSEHLAGFPEYVSTPEMRIEVSEESKFELVRRATEHFGERYDTNEVDGVRILFGDGWGLLRTSNTQPVVVARFEARTAERRDEIRDEVLGWLEEQGVHV